METSIVVRRNAGAMKWGYEPHPTNPELMVGNAEKLGALAEAYGLLAQGCSYRDVARWLSATTEEPYDYSALCRSYRRWRHAQETKPPTLLDLIDPSAMVAAK